MKGRGGIVLTDAGAATLADVYGLSDRRNVWMRKILREEKRGSETLDSIVAER